MEDVLEVNEKHIDKLRAAQALKEKNLAFFKKFHPGIYNAFAEYVLKDVKVSLNTELDQLDVFYDGKSIYNNRPIAEAKEVIAEFESKFKPQSPLNTIHPPFNTYMHPRFFHQRCDDIIQQSPIKSHNYLHYTIPDFYPLIIFSGLGSGYHLEMFLNKHDVINAVIVEPNPDLFACTLYLIDWEPICQPFLDHKERNIHFIVGPIEKEEHISALLMSYLVCHCPLYPITTLFINHKSLDLYKRVTDKINKDTNAFVSTWGYYDDEINQLNNCLHNLHLGIPIIKKNQPEFLDLPIFIVGAGPSLDQRIELIKEYKDKALIISCGTAIHCLYKHGIKPDIQFELESDQCTVASLDELGDPDWIRSIPMMGPSQLAPRLYKLVDKKVVFFKGESVTSMLFGDAGSSVYKATPTCTNGAMGVFSHWGFKNIFMFGMDFGYRDVNNHHASGSLYYTSTDPLMMADADVADEAKIDIKAVDGATIRTKPLLYTAMRSVEILVKHYEKFVTYYNCSDGAAMQNTTWLKENDLPIKACDIDPSLKIDFMHLQFEQSEAQDVSTIEEKLKTLSHNMSELGNYLVKEINKIYPNMYSMTSQINNMSMFLEHSLKPEMPTFYFFMRGSLWHLFYIGYSHALSITDKKELVDWINTWKKKTKSTILDMITHYDGIVFKEFDYDTDPWMTRSASDPE